MTTNHEQHGANAPPGPDAGADRPSHLSFVAHEIRNPLSTALWTSELLARLSPADRSGPRGEKLAAICLRSVSRVRLLVEDHLLCERLDAGAYPIRLEPAPIHGLLVAIQGRWPAGSGALTLPTDQGYAALADRGLLERALDGLLAAAAGAEEAAVRVEVARRAECLEVRVSGGPVTTLADPGRGTPSEQRGRSLALAMTRRVAGALGGSLAVDGDGYLLSIPAA